LTIVPPTAGTYSVYYRTRTSYIDRQLITSRRWGLNSDSDGNDHGPSEFWWPEVGDHGDYQVEDSQSRNIFVVDAQRDHCDQGNRHGISVILLLVYVAVVLVPLIFQVIPLMLVHIKSVNNLFRAFQLKFLNMVQSSGP
jgi:hypothetical protein